MAALNNFGAIFTFAIEFEGQLADYFQKAGQADLASASSKRKTNFERVRRENITEIKLEPIEGLDSDNYAIDASDTSAEGVSNAKAIAIKFYNDVAPQINVREAQRALEKAAKQYGV